jgi:asparagine synthase (glutamine-hydrolysing)
VAYAALLGGLYDPRGRLRAEAAREQVERALALYGPVRVEQWGPLTVGLAAAGDDMAAASGSAWCAFEGEPRVRGTWASAQDLAAAWARDGDDALAAFRGAFSAVFWDEARHRGLVVRDQMGQRPLLWHGGSRLAFAGEVRPLLDLVTPRPAPDDAAVACWLGSLVPAGDRTLYQGVRRLPGGHLLELADGAWAPRAYWRPRYQTPMQGSREELLGGMLGQLETATSATLDGASTPAVLLSGGIDSTSVAAIAAPLAARADRSLSAYSAVFPELPEADESGLIDDLVESLGLRSTSMAVRGGSLLAGLLTYARAWHMPDISANNFFWIDLLKQAGADGVDALLDGEGGDELFMVPRYLLADLLGRGRIGEARRLLREWPMIAGVHSRRVSAGLVARFGLAGLVPHAVDRATWLARRHESLVPLAKPAEATARRAADPTSWKLADGPRWWRHLAHHMTEGPDSFGSPEHALRIGRMAGVVRRRPLLDLDLSEYVLRMPPTLAFAPWFTKGHIRSAMVERVPDSILLRRHKTVFTDVRVRALESDVPLARQLLGPGAEVRRYVRADVVDAVLEGLPSDADADARSSWGFRLQHLAGTEFWLRLQADPGSTDPPLTGAGLEPVRYDLLLKQGGAA